MLSATIAGAMSSNASPSTIRTASTEWSSWVMPIGEALARCNARFATAWWHWFFMGQPAPLAERLIASDVSAWYRLDPGAMGEENYADVARVTASPAVQHAMCEDYRAGLGVDRTADDNDRIAGRQIVGPLLILWGE
jgi:haloacetate dehalogenase